jgi:inosose dehydratase
VALVENRPIFSDAQWDALTEGLNHLGDIARSEGMRLCYHHHMGTGVMTRADIDRLMAATDEPTVFLLLDTGHLAYAGDDPLACAKDYAHRIKHLHLKNIRRPNLERALQEQLSFHDAIEAGVFTVPGDPDGCIDFEPILRTMADAGFEGWIVVEAEQDPAKAHPLTYAKMARAYLRQTTGR